MSLEDYRPMMERCSNCSYCKWTPFDKVRSQRFGDIDQAKTRGFGFWSQFRQTLFDDDAPVRSCGAGRLE